MRTELDELVLVKPGSSLLDVVTAARINAMQSLIKKLWNGENLQNGSGVRKKTFAGSGFMLSFDALNSGLVTPKPLQMFNASDSDGHKILIVIGDVGGDIPDGFSLGDSPPYIMDVGASGIVYIEVTIDTGSGAITSRSIGHADSLPDSSIDDGDYYMTLGSYNTVDGALVVANSAYGPVICQVCEVEYSNPTKYKMTFWPQS